MTVGHPPHSFPIDNLPIGCPGGISIPDVDFLLTGSGLRVIALDFKTAASLWPQDRADRSLQVDFYLAALTQMGLNPGLHFRFIVFVKEVGGAVQVLRTERTVAQLLALHNTIRGVWQGIADGAFPPDPGNWLCRYGYCDYKDICEYGGVR